MIELTESRIYDFEEFRLDAKNHRLFRLVDNEIVPVTPKAVELLICLVENAGRILSKDELIEKVWENSFVEEANLSQTIFVLRKTLGENTKKPRFILTAPNRGYQFIADVTRYRPEDRILEENILSENSQTPNLKFPTSENQEQKTVEKRQQAKFMWLAVPLVLLIILSVYWFYPKPTPANLKEIKTIAILPFEDLSEGQTEKYLGASMADALTSKFGSLNQIIVRPTRSVLKYSDSREDAAKIGRELQVDAVLDGRIQRIGERIRVSVQLTRTADNATIWAENFDDQFTNFFAVQDSISQKVVQSLALQINKKESDRFNKRSTENIEAYQDYLHGRYYWNKRTPENLQKAVEQFEKAKQLDPKFALAYIGLADCYVLLAEYRVMPPKESFPKARQAISDALEIDNQLTDARVSLAYILANFDWDFAAAEREFKNSIEQNPNNATAHQWYAEFLQLVGRFDESLIHLRRAEEIDPLSLIIKVDTARYFYLTRQFDNTIEQTDKILAIDPNYGWGYAFRWLAYKEKGMLKEAIGTHQKTELLFGRSAKDIEERAKIFAQKGWKGYWRKWLEQSEKPELSPFIQAFDKASVYHYLNDKEKTYEFLEKSFERREPWLLSIKYAPDFADMQDEPRFQNLLRRIGF